MAIVVAKYQSNEGDTRAAGRRFNFVIKVREEVLDFSPGGTTRNAAPTSGIDIPLTILSTANKDRAGLAPRGVRLSWVGVPPAGYDPEGKVFVPILTPSLYQICHIGRPVDFLGAEAMIVGLVAETVRM